MIKKDNILLTKNFKKIITPLKYLGIGSFKFIRAFNKDSTEGYLHPSSEIITKSETEYYLDKFKTSVPLSNNRFKYLVNLQEKYDMPSFILYELEPSCLNIYIFHIDKAKVQVTDYFNFLLSLESYLLKFQVYFKVSFEMLLKKHLVNKDDILNVEPLDPNKQDIGKAKFTAYLKLKKLPIISKYGEVVILSKQQSLLMLALIRGLSLDEIEKIYKIKKKSCELYLKNIKHKTGYRNRIELILAFLDYNPWIHNEDLNL